MPIRILGSTDARAGRIVPTLGALAAEVQGLFTQPPSYAGRILSTVGGLVPSMRGQFGVPASRNGAIEANLGSLIAQLQSQGGGETEAQASWLERSTADGVIWAHDFSESANELEYFTRDAATGLTNPDPDTQITPLTLVDSPFGSSKAIRSQAIGALITSDIAEATKGTTGVSITVNDASRFPDPSDYGGSYQLLIGCTDPDGRNTNPAVFEIVAVTGRNTGSNTLTITRTAASSGVTVTVEGTTYSGGGTTAPAIPGTSGFYTIGYPPTGSWNRPLCAFPAGQNGKSADDIGITNGAAAKTRTWDSTRNGTGHNFFREGYWGSKHYWDEATNPSAPYKDWTPTHSGDGQNFAHEDAFEGDEFYLQFRVKVSEARLRAAISKLFFIQNAATSGAGQLFCSVGKNAYGTPPPDERIDAVFGHLMVTQTGGGDSRQPAGGVLGSSYQYTGLDPDGGNGRIHTDYPWTWNTKANADAYAFCHQAEQWVTILVHMKLGRDNAEAFHPTGTGSMSAPFPSASDATYRTQVEVKVSLPGRSYKTLVSKSDCTWFFGDQLGDLGNLIYNAPGLNTFWGGLNFNMYLGSGSVAPPDGVASADYTQVILSRNPIPEPIDVDYERPAAGEALAIGQTNTAGSVYPSSEGWSEGAWLNSAFASFGSGTFVPWYSSLGAWISACTGGHNHSDNHGALGFDFTNRTWFRQDNANGVARVGSHPFAYTVSDTNGSPWYEVGNFVPAPPHIYCLLAGVNRGDKGSVLTITRPFVCLESANSDKVHRFDLATRLWSRVGSSNPTQTMQAESDAVVNAARNVIWYVPKDLHNYKYVHYFDLADDTFKSTSPYADFSPSAFGQVSRVMLHDGYLIKNTADVGGLFLFDPDDPTAGWIELDVDETAASLPFRYDRWARFHGKWYSMPAAGGNTLTRITPPTNPKTGTWVVDEVTLTGDTLPAAYGSATTHYARLFEVPFLDRLAWIPGGNEDVYLLYPE